MMKNSNYWDFVDRKPFGEVVTYSSMQIKEAKEELFLAITLGLNDPIKVKKTSYILSDIELCESKLPEKVNCWLQDNEQVKL